MLTGTLLHSTQPEKFRDTDGFLRRGSEALPRAASGLRSYATLRSGRAAAEAAGGAGDQRLAFNDATAAVAEAAGYLTKDYPDELVGALSDLLAEGALGTAAVRAYWVGLGFSPAEVDSYLAEAVTARAGLPDIARLVQAVADWQAPLAHFGAGHPDHRNWGFGFSADGTLHEDARAFAVASRDAGVTPSLYLMMTIVLLLHKLAEELAEA